MILILTLLLQIHPESTFSRYLREAQEKLGLIPTRVEVTTTQIPGFEVPVENAAWVPYGFGARPSVVYVRPDFLRESALSVQEVVAFHESCHLYIGTNRRYPSPGEIELQHLMIDGCVEWLLGPRHHHAMTTIPCGRWYPYEALRYNRRIGRSRCKEVR